MHLLLDPTALPLDHSPDNRDHLHLPPLLPVCVQHPPVLLLPRTDPLQLLQGDEDCVECASVLGGDEVRGQMGCEGWLVHVQEVEEG